MLNQDVHILYTIKLLLKIKEKYVKKPIKKEKENNLKNRKQERNNQIVIVKVFSI